LRSPVRATSRRGTTRAVAGRSAPEIPTALEAVAHGVASAHIIDGRMEHGLLLEVLSNSGDGTIVLPERAPHFVDDSLKYLDR
jgi:acetylglutamate kinase